LETKKGMMKIENDLQKQHGGCIIGANILPPLISKLFKYLVGKIKRCNVCKIYKTKNNFRSKLDENNKDM
jgi:hypothetical protein